MLLIVYLKLLFIEWLNEIIYFLFNFVTVCSS